MKKSVTKKTISMLRVAVTCSITASTLLLAGCSLLQGPAPQRSQPVQQQKPERKAKPEVKREIIKAKPDGSAQDNLMAFTDSLDRLAESDKEFNQDSIRGTLTEAGFDAKNMDLTKNITVMGDAYPTFFVAVHVKGECLIGQLVTDGRQSTASVMPAIGPKKDVCIIQNPYG